MLALILPSVRRLDRRSGLVTNETTTRVVYFFFKLGTAQLTDRSQLVNLDEIARIAKDHDLILRIDGAADIETGSSELNKELSRKRCQFMYLELKRRGIPADHLKAYWHGGVNEHARNEEDRNSKISVYLE